MTGAAPSSSRPLLLPVESQIREFESKLLLACVAAERGFRVILGSRAALHLAIGRLPRGVYLAKSLAPTTDKIFGIMRELGHEIVAWVDDALVHFPADDYYALRISPFALQQTSRLLAWGAENEQLLEGCPAYHGVPIHVTGNPRVDLLRPELRPYFADDVASIRARFGDFVLINTNFSKLNHYLPKRESMTHAAAAEKVSRGDEFLAGAAAHRGTLFSHFKEMIPALARAFPGTAIVVRPHPVEDPETWRAFSVQHPNVHVVLEGSVVPWLLAGKVLIHNACTTGVEAFLMGVPTITYHPLDHTTRFDPDLTNGLGERASDLDELTVKVRSALAGEDGARRDSEQWKHLEHYVAAFEGRLASDRIVDVLLEMAGGAVPPRPRLDRYLQGWLRANVRAASKRLQARRPGNRRHAEYDSHRFPLLEPEDLAERIRRLGSHLQRFEGLRIHPLSDHLFVIEC